jgi:hypothetical protein
LFESTAVLAAEGQDLGPKIRGFSLNLLEDGLHASGRWRGPFGIEIPFDAVLDPVWVAPDAFELRLRDIRVAGVDLESLSGLVLEAAKKRLDGSLKGICTFSYVGKSKLRARALRVQLDMAALIPAFPDLALTGITTRDGELLLKAGRP